MISFDHLNPTQFEEFCYDLLASLNFQNITWRKGTGLSTSPADQGRDLEASIFKRDVDGQTVTEIWHIECKHYKSGVPPEKLQSAIAWAASERPDVLLIIASGFLSNAAKNFIKDYQDKTKPSFRIKIWEAKDIEGLVAEAHALKAKYALPNDLPFVSILNKYHLTYAVKPFANTMEFFFQLMDSLDHEIRDRTFASTYHDIIAPRYREPLSPDEKLIDMRLDRVDYSAFREKCLALAEIEGAGLVHRIVSEALSWMFHMGDRTMLNVFIRRNRLMHERALKEAQSATAEKEREDRLRAAEESKRFLEKLPDQVEQAYADYCYICENLVRKLLSESGAP